MATNVANQPVTYKPLRKNPLDWNRSSTHVIFVYIFICLVILYGISFFVLYLNNYHGPEDREWPTFLICLSHTKYTSMYIAIEYWYYSGYGLVGMETVYAAATGICTLCILLPLRWIPKVYTYFGIFCLGGFIVFLIYDIYRISYDVISRTFFEDFTLTVVLYLVITLISNIFTIIIFLTILFFCIDQAKLLATVEVFKKSVRAILFFPSLILFGFFILILNMFVTFDLIFLDFGRRHVILSWITKLGGTYVHICICYFAKMVISKTIASWHWTENKKEISFFTLLDSIGIVCRFHLGAVLYAATIVLPLIAAIRVACKHRCAESKFGNIVVEIIFKVFLIWNMAEYALIVTSLCGYDFISAAKTAYQLMVKKCAFSLAVDCIFNAILTIGSVVAFLLVAWLLNFPTNSCRELMLSVGVIPFIYAMYISYVRTLTHVCVMAETVVHTTFLCSLKDSTVCSKSRDNECAMPLNGIV